MHGIVRASTQPVAGASVYLYAAGTSGYASASVPIFNPSTAAFATTDSSGNFTIPAGYACPDLASQVYLVALGGQVGTTDPNPNLGLMTALGSCSNLSPTPVVINEITTVATATALATFSADNVQTGELSYLYIGSSSANSTVGLANAFASVNNLVDVTTGQPKFWTVAGNAAVPYVQINTLADALNACAVTAGGSPGDGTVCGNLFTYTNPLTKYPALAPTDTLQATFDLVKTPSPKVASQVLLGSVYGLANVSSPYQPILNSAPSQWSISLNYTSGGGVGGSGNTSSNSSALAVDTSGNVWIANKSTNSVSEWNSLGASYSPKPLGTAPGGFTGGGVYAPAAIAVDPNGYIWVANGNSTLTKLDLTGAADPNSPFSGGGLSTGSGIAIDSSSDIWVTNSGSPGAIARFSSNGIALSPANGYTDGVSNPNAIALDNSGNVWIQNTNPQNTAYGITELNGASGTPLISSAGNISISVGASGQRQMAADGSGNLWVPVFCGVQSLTPRATDPQILDSTQYQTLPTLANASAVAMDGSNRSWIASTGGQNCTTLRTVPPSVLLIDSGSGYAFVDDSLSNGPSYIAVDGSGNLWILLNNNTVTEFVGLATPAVTPLATAVKNKKLGAKP